MKKLFLFLFLLSFGFSLRAQTYQPFPTSNVLWQVKFFNADGNWYIKYLMEGDTILNGENYHKIFQNSFENYVNYRGALIESDKKIWFRHRDSLNNKLLYDFNLKLNDTVKSSLIKNNCFATVFAIDSIKIKSKWHKRVFFSELSGNCSVNGYFVEGIGGSQGLLEDFDIGINGSSLQCVSINNETIYPDSTYNCNLINSIKELKEGKGIKLFPNPIAISGIIDFSYDKRRFKKIEIYNSIGQKLSEADIRSKEEYRLSSHDYVPGYYFYKISNDKEFLSGKFIIQ